MNSFILWSLDDQIHFLKFYIYLCLSFKQFFISKTFISSLNRYMFKKSLSRFKMIEIHLNMIKYFLFHFTLIVVYFLRTARSFYESLWYLLTYLLTYVRTSHLWEKSSYTKTYKTKNVRNYTSQCSKFFLFWRNPKNDQVRAKKPILGPKNLN